MLKISHKLKKSYLGNTRGSCRHSYLHTKAEFCGNFLASPKIQPQTVDKEGRRQGWTALHMILHLADHAGHVKRKRSNIWACAWSYWPDTWAIPLSSITSEQAAKVACCEPDSHSILLVKFASSCPAEPPSQDFMELEPMQCPATAPTCRAESLWEASGGTNSQQLARSASKEVRASPLNKPSPSPFPHRL